MSFRRGSDIYFVPAGKRGIKHGLGCSALTSLVGRWGIPWGSIYSIQSLYTNFTGGKDVTPEIVQQINARRPAPVPVAPPEPQVAPKLPPIPGTSPA